MDNKYPIDLYIPVINPPYVTTEQTIQATCNFDDFRKISKDTEVLWGPGIMLEIGFPLAIHLGCKKIITIGWDGGDPSKIKHDHFYNDANNIDTVPMDGEVLEAVKSTSKMYEWFVDNGIEFNIVSDINKADKRINRLDIGELSEV